MAARPPVPDMVMTSIRRSRATVSCAVVCAALTLACSGEPAWQERWELQTASEGDVESSATLGLLWDDDEHTRGEYGFAFTANRRTGQQSLGAWRTRGTFTAESVSPDFCGRAKWPSGSTCLAIELWPRGDEPAPELQEQIDRLGLPDRQVQRYLVFRDGRTRGITLVRNVDGAVETQWRDLGPSK